VGFRFDQNEGSTCEDNCPSGKRGGLLIAALDSLEKSRTVATKITDRIVGKRKFRVNVIVLPGYESRFAIWS